MRDIFDSRLMQNNLRGIWAEYMVADALGRNCSIVSQSWNAWDLQFGDPASEYPNRIRIQVKNTARTQVWHQATRRLTDCQWSLALRNKSAFFDRDNPGVQCEDYGFLCDVFVLCHHFIEDWKVADHRDARQWRFFVVPVTLEHSIYRIVVPETSPRKSKTYTVVPASLKKWIRGRPPIRGISIEELTEDYVRKALGQNLGS